MFLVTRNKNESIYRIFFSIPIWSGATKWSAREKLSRPFRVVRMILIDKEQGKKSVIRARVRGFSSFHLVFLWSIGPAENVHERETWRKIRRTSRAANGNYPERERERERERGSLSSCRSYNCRRTDCVYTYIDCIYTLKPSISTRPASKHFNYLCGSSARACTEGRFVPSLSFLSIKGAT